MRFGFKQPLVGEKRCVMTLITAAEETIFQWARAGHSGCSPIPYPGPALPLSSGTGTRVAQALGKRLATQRSFFSVEAFFIGADGGADISNTS